MKIATTCLTLALAQGAGDAMEKLRACSLLAPAERLECLEKLARDLAPPPRPVELAAPGVAPAADNWMVSETTSPLDYTPVAIATASSGGGPDGAPLHLSIQCRGGRTDLVIGGPALTRRAEDYVVSYAINDGQPVVVAAGTPASGTGVAIRGDVAPAGVAARLGRRHLSRHRPAGPSAGRAIRPRRPENRAGPAGRPLQMARRRRAAQLMISEQRSIHRRA
jgi:hypothetical protein